MVTHQDAESRDGLSGTGQAGLQARQDECKGITLYQIEEFLLAVKVIVEAREGDTSGAADAPDGSAFKALFGEDAGRKTEDVLQLGFGVTQMGDEVGHGSDIERSFDTLIRGASTVKGRAEIVFTLQLDVSQLQIKGDVGAIRDLGRNCGAIGLLLA